LPARGDPGVELLREMAEKVGQARTPGSLSPMCSARPFTTGSGYVNFMMGDEGDAQVKATYGANFERLQTVKRKFDPNNVFRVNQNIKP
jgi:hypothetical protein